MTEPTPKPREIPDSGDLSQVSFTRVFYRFCKERRSGFLDIKDKPPDQGGKTLKRIIMTDGANFAVQGGAVAETLGQISADKGKISPEQYEELKNKFKNNHGKIEEEILSGAVISPAELPNLVEYQASLKIRTAFSLVRGYYEFKAKPRDELSLKHVLVPLSPDKVVMEGVKNFYPMTRIKKEYTGIDKKVFLSSNDGGDRITGLGLAPGALRWLRNLPASFNWSTLLKDAPMSQDDAVAILMAMFFTEIIVLPEEEEDFPIGLAYEERKEPLKKPEPEKAKVEEKPAAETKSAKKPEGPKLPIEEMLDMDLSDDELLAEIDKYMGMITKKDTTYFDLLGVNQTTPPDKIKQVYFKFAKKFHPDAKPALYQGQVRNKVEDIFTKVSEGYNILSDKEARENYITSLKSKVSKEDMEKAQRAIEAEMEFQKAEILLRKGSWAQAIEILQRVNQLQEDEPEYEMYLAWATYKQKGPSETAKAKKVINQTLEKRPKAADGYYYLGQIAKSEGEINKAEEYFSQASKLRPHDVDIKRELQLIQRQMMKQATAPKKGGGLFGRKK